MTAPTRIARGGAPAWPQPWWLSRNGETEVRLYAGHVLDVLRRLPPASVNLVMTSPPYWGLRDYGPDTAAVWGGDPGCPHDDWRNASVVRKGSTNGRPDLGSTLASAGSPKTMGPGMANDAGATRQRRVDVGAFCRRCGAWRGQLGLEPSVALYVEHLLAVFDEVRRVLRPDGACFVNLGDTYAGSWGNCGAREGRQRPRAAERWERRGYEAGGGWDGLPPQAAAAGVRRKSLAGVPWRFALAMVDRGWVLRNAVVWHKPSAMPSSVRDRFANAYEFLFFLAPGERYWFDLDAVREPFKTGPARFSYRVRDAAAGRLDAKFGDMYVARPEEVARYEEVRTRPGHVEVVRGPMRMKTAREDAFRTGAAMRQAPEPGEEHAFHPLGRNPGDVWSIAREPFQEAHFATYPTALCERVILAGCPPRVCAACGAPWARVVEPTGHRNARREPAHVPGNTPTKVDSTGWAPTARPTALFRPTCRCGPDAGWRPGVVLDPFAGSGTTLLVAQRLGRDAVGIELKPEYLEMARRRVGREHRQQRLPVGGGG